MKSFATAIRNGDEGFAVYNSVFLQFHCEIISIWIGKEMSLLSVPDEIADLGDAGVIGIREEDSYTNLVFRKWGDLSKELGRHKGHITLHAAEKGEDMFKAVYQNRVSRPSQGAFVRDRQRSVRVAGGFQEDFSSVFARHCSVTYGSRTACASRVQLARFTGFPRSPFLRIFLTTVNIRLRFDGYYGIEQLNLWEAG
jgi:hypothetical protein